LRAPPRRAYTKSTAPLLAAALVLGIAVSASAKLVCPPGRFTMQSADARFDGSELVLGRGRVTMAPGCASVRAGRYLPAMNRWLLRVNARWNRCHGRAMVMRARFDPTDPGPCGRIDGRVKTRSGRKIAFTATRIPECGNEIREPGEQCDGSDGSQFALDCCNADCRVKPECRVVCDFRRGFRCEGADKMCVTPCGFSGMCWPRADVQCDSGPVCDCSGEVTYSSNCAAYDAGAGVRRKGACAPTD
jgi:hypothetical protein